MPTIEIYGVRGKTRLGSKITTLAREISNLFSDAPYAGEIVVSQIPSIVRTLNGVDAPFLRIVASAAARKAHLNDILSRLEPLNMDIEVAPLVKFIEKKELPRLVVSTGHPATMIKLGDVPDTKISPGAGYWDWLKR